MELAKKLKIESVARLYPTPPVVFAPEQTVAEAVAEMRQRRVGCVVICKGSELQGIFTERDLLRRVLAPGALLTTPLREFMTRNPVTVQSKESVGAALRRMQQGGYRHLPVLDENDQLVGVLSVKRIIHYLVEHFPTTVINLPPDPDIVYHREGA